MRILITGTPGVGKTTISTKISFLLKISYINVNSLILNLKLYSKYDPHSRSYIINVKKTKTILSQILNVLRDVILDHHEPSIIPTEMDLVIVLRINPKVLLERLLLRGYPKSKVAENVEAELLGICYEEAQSSFTCPILDVDITHLNVHSAAKYLISIIKKYNSEKYEYIDWLSKMHKDDLKTVLEFTSKYRIQGL